MPSARARPQRGAALCELRGAFPGTLLSLGPSSGWGSWFREGLDWFGCFKIDFFSSVVLLREMGVELQCETWVDGKVQYWSFLIFCFAIVTTCHCLDVKMPKMIQLLLFPTRPLSLLKVASAFAGHITGFIWASPKALREGTGLYLRLSLISCSSLLSWVRSVVQGRSFCHFRASAKLT